MAAKLVIIEDAVVTALLSNPAATTALPGLKSAAALAGSTAGCKPCQAKAKARTRSINYAQVKATIGNMRGESLAALKRILNAEKVRVTFKSSANKQVTLTM